MKIQYDVGAFCKEIRNHYLKITLQEMSEKTGLKKSTLSAFEHGRSTNINLFFTYLDLLKLEDDKNTFINKVLKLLEVE